MWLGRVYLTEDLFREVGIGLVCSEHSQKKTYNLKNILKNKPGIGKGGTLALLAGLEILASTVSHLWISLLLRNSVRGQLDPFCRCSRCLFPFLEKWEEVSSRLDRCRAPSIGLQGLALAWWPSYKENILVNPTTFFLKSFSNCTVQVCGNSIGSREPPGFSRLNVRKKLAGFLEAL